MILQIAIDPFIAVFPLVLEIEVHVNGKGIE
jgi:hypothetical protein